MEKENNIKNKSPINSNRRKLLSLAGAAGTAALLSPLISKAAPTTIIEAGSNVDTASYIIFKDGNMIYAKNGTTGKVELQNIDSTIVFNTLIDNKNIGSIFIHDGLYTINNPIIIKRPNLTITFSGNAVLQVPNGYDDNVIIFTNEDFNLNRPYNIVINGGHIIENGGTAIGCSTIPQRKWTAIKFNGIIGGIFFNTIRDLEIRDANIGIDFETHTYIDSKGTAKVAWMNGNSFQELKLWGCNYFINFNPPTIEGKLYFNSNNFTNIFCQSCRNTLYGVKDIRGSSNIFNNVVVWDLTSDAVSSSIADDAYHTNIIGGIMTHKNFVDKGHTTIKFDSESFSINRRLRIVPKNADVTGWGPEQAGNLWIGSDGIPRYWNGAEIKKFTVTS